MDPFERGDCPPGLMIANPAALTNNLAFVLLTRALCRVADKKRPATRTGLSLGWRVGTQITTRGYKSRYRGKFQDFSAHVWSNRVFWMASGFQMQPDAQSHE